MKYIQSKAYADSKYDAVKLVMFFLLIQHPIERLRVIAINMKERNGEYLATAIAFTPGLLVKKEDVPGNILRLHPCEISFSINHQGILPTVDKLTDIWARNYGDSNH